MKWSTGTRSLRSCSSLSSLIKLNEQWNQKGNLNKRFNRRRIWQTFLTTPEEVLNSQENWIEKLNQCEVVLGYFFNNVVLFLHRNRNLIFVSPFTATNRQKWWPFEENAENFVKPLSFWKLLICVKSLNKFKRKIRINVKFIKIARRKIKKKRWTNNNVIAKTLFSWEAHIIRHKGKV